MNSPLRPRTLCKRYISAQLEAPRRPFAFRAPVEHAVAAARRDAGAAAPPSSLLDSIAAPDAAASPSGTPGATLQTGTALFVSGAASTATRLPVGDVSE